MPYIKIKTKHTHQLYYMCMIIDANIKYNNNKNTRTALCQRHANETTDITTTIYTQIGGAHTQHEYIYIYI